MKVPAIRAKIGTWTYYISTLTFEQVSNHVEKIDEQLHRSRSLQDLIQRSITKNYESIKEYILNQDERFFNSLVLAVYNGTPSWIEIELHYEDSEYFNLGFLDFSVEQKIFPVDGQHRAEGIKAALLVNPNLAKEQIGAIFIGHNVSPDGMRKSRRLFSTLNRYAKPVTMDDIIALDEDDSIAIVTRFLLENTELFREDRVTKSKNKAINDGDKTAITSIITLYQCNRELLKLFRAKRRIEAPNEERDSIGLDSYLKFRPKEEEIELFTNFTLNLWGDFSNHITAISNFTNNNGENPAAEYRNKDNGGNLLFRPVGLLPFIQASIEIHKRTNLTFADIFVRLNAVDMTIVNSPWKNVLWNPLERTMIMGTSGIVKLLLLYIFGSIRPHEITTLKRRYADKLSLEENEINDSLNGIIRL